MMETIDWTGAMDRNREALLRVVDALFAMVGLVEGRGLGSDPRTATLPRCTRNAVLRILRPAEAAVRRLILIAARGVKATVRPPDRKARNRHRVIRGPRIKSGSDAPRSATRSTADTVPSLPLVDYLKRFDFGPPRRRPKGVPRISVIGVTEPRPIPGIALPSPDDELDAARICRRLRALKRALDDLPGQAKRFARWRARRDAGLLRSPRLSPLRPGWPPGFRKRPVHEIDHVLRECHALAWKVWEAPDSS